ncbi:hypothetical protein [Streptomyces mirabilis]|uniref:hypothetical protein n=1 Tax=Streptomyces mirabilis TaxID=68239 RepID=UPI003673FD57
MHAVVAQGLGLAGADAVEGFDGQRSEPVGRLAGADGEDAAWLGDLAGGGGRDRAVGPIPTRTSTPSREMVRTRSTSPSRRPSTP